MTFINFDVISRMDIAINMNNTYKHKQIQNAGKYRVYEKECYLSKRGIRQDKVTHSHTVNAVCGVYRPSTDLSPEFT